MGVWDEVRRGVRRELLRVLRGSAGQSRTGARRYPTAGDTTLAALKGPDPGTLLTADEIEAATGNRPIGEGDRKSGGMEVDVGYSRVCEWTLTGGDELLINVTRFPDQAAASLWESRNWNQEKPLGGLAEVGRFKVAKDPKGRTELHVTAKQGMYAVYLVHSSAARVTDITPLKELMRTVLSRLD